jgi:tRNA nucleotidyltransferase (CCA-adding enzyme)
VNAIALGLSGPRRGAILDPYDGLGDLAARRFRVLHERSFEDDATRLWRAGRLSAQQRLRPEASTRRLIEDGTRWLGTISGDRVWNELSLIAARGRAGTTLALLDEWGVLGATSAGLRLSDGGREALRYRWRPMPAARLVAVLLARREPKAANAALERLNAPAEAIRAVADARALLASPDADPDTLEGLARTGEDGRTAARWLDPRQAELQRALRRWERTRPQLPARELLAMGVVEGPALGSLLRCLRRGRYLGTLGSVAEARALVRRHLDRREDAG